MRRVQSTDSYSLTSWAGSCLGRSFRTEEKSSECAKEVGTSSCEVSPEVVRSLKPSISMVDVRYGVEVELVSVKDELDC